jgi:phosphoserine phosphatase RsbU/P
VFSNSPSGKYATLFAARYDAENRQLCYCNAGHLPPIVISNGKTTRLESGGTVLGLFETVSYSAASVTLDPGSLVAVYTDGVTEAVNAADEEFGEERLLDALRGSRDTSSEGIYREVTSRVRDWQGGLKQHDDITLIVARVF